GRFLYGNTAVNSERNIYAGDNATYQLAVRPGTIGSTGQLDVNAGEQFLWEGNFTFASGHPSGVGPDTLSLPGLGSAAAGKNVANFWEAVVVAGQGLGQHRLVTAYNGGSTITVSPPWQVPPDGGSLVILCQDLDKCVLYQNQIQGKSDYGTFASSSLGIEPYGGSFDFIADGNNIQQVRRGINSFSRAETNHDLGSIEPVYFNLYQNNLISSVLVGASGIISDWSPGLTDYPGILYLGNLFRGNGINGAAQAGIQLSLGNITAIPGMQMDMNVFEANAVSNTPLAVSCIGSATAQPLGPQLGNTLFYANQFNGCTCSSAPAGSQGIVFGAGQSPALQRNSWA
ncbi:MAG TPA: hypothetical protein VNZ67_08710, partial [bacterium]|nr:hypothetical protein [bacterium]